MLLDFEFSLYRLYKVFPYLEIELSDSDFKNKKPYPGNKISFNFRRIKDPRKKSRFHVPIS